MAAAVKPVAGDRAGGNGQIGKVVERIIPLSHADEHI
jgi:hypothetical protein